MLSAIEARKEFEKLLQYLEIGINGIDYTALCTDATVHNPSDEDVQQLLDFANSAEQRRQELLKEALEEGIEEDEKSELGSISKETEDALYRRKRAEQLARLLMAKKAILEVYNSSNFGEIWADFCRSRDAVSLPAARAPAVEALRRPDRTGPVSCAAPSAHRQADGLRKDRDTAAQRRRWRRPAAAARRRRG